MLGIDVQLICDELENQEQPIIAFRTFFLPVTKGLWEEFSDEEFKETFKLYATQCIDSSAQEWWDFVQNHAVQVFDGIFKDESKKVTMREIFENLLTLKRKLPHDRG